MLLCGWSFLVHFKPAALQTLIYVYTQCNYKLYQLADVLYCIYIV